MFSFIVMSLLVMQVEVSEPAKLDLWNTFVTAHQVHDQSVPLFAMQDGNVVVMNYGSNKRKVLKRSDEMEQRLRKLGTQLIAEHKEGKSVHDGILYMMLAREGETLVPLYIGKAETFGKGDRNLSANIRDLANGTAMFGRWGYNYAYHIGDLSAVTLSGHPDTKASIKYKAWRDKLFSVENDVVKPKTELLFWAKLWGPECQSIWKEYGTTRLAFEEYLVIGVASDVFPQHLLNREGRTR
ncbi:hypothetical protein VN12_24950 [Pirellula sp. SH-Sr6A]|uniref:hypothetical protein n=1 Tax=Pirellula sp. SH-Sr6A TaxID=1632865 RepID=UPI00078D0EB3|nr:hypothetical protein [Pirellula sp. SH-Sr6A]AMV35362.1 hypothetical protein VN12_24950 [Pirellula sp. SH-Sr6A]